MSHIDIKKAPSMAAVIPFYVAAALAFLALSVMMFFSADAFMGHYFQPKILAIVHTAALGWGTMIIFGSLYQLIPVIFEQELYSSRIAVLSFGFLATGSVLLIYSFWQFNVGTIMQAGALTVLSGIILFAVNVFLTASGSNKYSIQKDFITMSCLWLLITAAIGTLLAFNFRYQIFDKNHLEILNIHAHIGLAGWFLMLIIGAASKLIPMFFLSKSSRPQLLSYAFYTINLGLAAFLFDGFLWGLDWRAWIYAAVIGSGIVAALIHIYELFRNRARKAVDFQMKHTMFSMMFLLLAFCHIPIIILFPEFLPVIVAYGSLLFIGWITGLILGMTFKTLPFIVWNDRYKEAAGKQKIPMPKDLYFEKQVKWQFYIYMAAIVLLLAGIYAATSLLVKSAAVAMMIAAVLYNLNAFKIIFHKKMLAA